MGFNLGGAASGVLGGASTGAALGSVIPGIGNITGGTIGAIGGGILGLFGGASGMSDEEKMEKAWEYEKEGMGLQYQYGQQAAEAQQQRNLEMWNATNFEAQRKHMENAGLSVGLMYGQGGAQAASTAGGNATQPSGPTSNPMAIMLQSKAIESQINLNNAQAAKAAAEAQKTAGVDTELGKKNIQEIETRINKEAAEYFKINKEADILYEKWKQEQNNTYISEETKYERVEEIKQQVENLKTEAEVMKADISLKNSGVNLNNKQAEYVGEKIKYYAKEIQAKVDTAEAAKDQAKNAANAIQNDKELRGTGLNIQTGNIIADAILSIINIGAQLYGGYKNRRPTETTTTTVTTNGNGGKRTITHSRTGKN